MKAVITAVLAGGVINATPERSGAGQWLRHHHPVVVHGRDKLRTVAERPKSAQPQQE